MAGYTRATGDWVKDSQAEKEKKKKEAEERKEKQEQAKREQQQRIAAQSKTVKKYERATGDWTHDSAVVQSRLAPYSRANLSRQNARQQKAESYMDLTTADEPKARAGIEMYKAKADAQKYAEMNRVGYRNYDQDTVNRSVKGYEESYQRWKKVYDANKGPAAIDPKTSRQSEIRSGEQKVQRYTDTGTGGSLGKDARADDKRWAGVTQELKRVGQEQRYLDTPGAKRTWSQEHHADESRERYRELYDRAFKSSEAEEKEPSVAERYSAANQKLRTAERDAYYWEQAAKDAAWFGDEQRFTRSLPHITESGRRAQGALAQFRAASDEMAGAVREQDEALKQGDLATWYARNLSDDEIRRRLEEEQKPISVTDKDRAENPGMYPDAAFRTMPRQSSFDPTMTAGGEEPGNRFYMTEQERQLTEQSDRELLQRKADDREVQITALQRALESHHVNDLEDRISWHAGRGELPEMAQAGREAFARDASGEGAAGRGVTFADLLDGTVSPEAMAQGNAAGTLATIQRNLLKCSSEQAERVYAMYAIDPQSARELSQKYYDDAMDEYYARFYRWASSDKGWQGGRRAVAALLGTGAKLLSGLNPFGDSGQDLSRTGEAFISGGAASASRNGIFGIEALGGDESPISGAVPFIGRGNAGEAYQLGASILESAAIAAPAMLAGRYDTAAAKVANLIGTTLMGSSAAADDYRECINLGMSDSQAKWHATAAGVAEAAFEYISLDKLIDPENIRHGLLRMLTQGGIEASEEVCTTIANRISDTLIADFYGTQNAIEREALEYQLHGMSAEEAEQKARNQWLAGLMMDGLGGLFSGLIMGGGSDVMQRGLSRVNSAMDTAAENYGSGSLLQLETAGYTNADTLDALTGYARANGIDVKALMDAQAKAAVSDQGAVVSVQETQGAETGNSQEAIGNSGRETTDRAEDGTPLIRQPEGLTPSPEGEGFGTETRRTRAVEDAGPYEERNAERDATEAAADNGEKPRLSKRDLRRAGKVRAQIVESLSSQFEGKTAAEQAAAYDSLVETYGSGIEAAASEALYNTARRTMQGAENVPTLEQQHGTDAEAFQSETARNAVERAYRDAQTGIMRATGDTTESSVRSLRDASRRAGDGFTMQAEITDKNGSTRTVDIKGWTKDGTKVVLQDGTQADVDSLQTDAATKDLLEAMQNAKFGAYADEAFQTFLSSGAGQSLADGHSWIAGYRAAFGVGEVRGNVTNAVRQAARYGVDMETAAAAYYNGVKATDTVREAAKKDLPSRLEISKKGITGKRGSVLFVSEAVENKVSGDAELQDFAEDVRNFAEFFGVEVTLTESKLGWNEKLGKNVYEGSRGAHQAGRIEIDINSGKNFLGDAANGILQTMGHEMTHFLRFYNEDGFQAVRDFATSQIVAQKGQEYLDELIQRQMDANEGDERFTRDDAIEEVVAEFCQDMLTNKKALETFAKESPKGFKAFVEWVKNFLAKIREKLARSPAATNELAIYRNLEEKVKDAFGELWAKEVMGSVRVHDAAFAEEQTEPGTETITQKEQGRTDEIDYSRYAGNALETDRTLFNYDYLVSLPDMIVHEAPPLSAIKTGKNIVQENVVDIGMKNVREVGKKQSDNTYAIKNRYTGRNISVGGNALDHGLNSQNVPRLRTNARLSSIAGYIIQDGLPINALKNENNQAANTYALAALVGSGNKDIVAIVTVEQHTGNLVGIDYYDVAHAINGRIRNEGSWSSTRETGQNPDTATFTISIADFLDIVNTTHRSILSDDVLEHYGEERPAEGHFTGRVKFQMRESIETTDRLVAWHNMNEDALRSALELGGLAMPSWAIKTADRAHTSYGSISVIAPRALVDPKLNRSSMIFGGDAWTPVFPDVDYDISYDAVENLHDEITGLIGEDVLRELGGASLDTENVARQLKNAGGKVSNYYKKNVALRYAYLKSIGKEIAIQRKEGRLDSFGKYHNEEIKRFANKLVDGRRTLQKWREMSSQEVMQQEDLKQAITDAMAETYGEEVRSIFGPEELGFADIAAMLDGANRLLSGKAESEIDRQALSKEIDEVIDEAAYEKWIGEKLNKTIEKRGIRNEKDMFTPSGNRRSFDALHYAYNLANIVKAMKAQPKQGRTQFLSGPGSVKGAALKSYNTVEQVRNDRGRLVNSAEEGQAAYDEYNRNLEDILDRMRKNGDRFDAADALIEVFQHAKTESGIYNYMQRELKDWYNISRELAHDAYELIGQINRLPMEYFEGKTYDAVRFDETAAVVVPDNIDPALKQQLEDAGANVVEYKAGDNADRLAKVNSVEGAKFQQRDYDAPSDVDLVMGMDEKDADTPEGKALIREVQAKQKQIETLREKLAEAKRQLTTTKRALNTKGIGNVAGNVIRDFGISDAGGKNIKQQATEILTDVYQKALDQIDSGAAAAEAWETVYNGAVEAANLLIDQGRYTENNNGRWTNVPYSRYIGENRQMVIDQMVSEAAVDFTRNCYRGPIQETAADRLVARTEKRIQGKLDETKAKNAELKAENERLEQDKAFLKDQADGARFIAGNLYDQVKDLRQELKDNRKLTAQERKSLQGKIDRLNKQIEAKRTEAAAWRDRANRNASLLKSALESKSRDIQTVKDESQRQVDRAVAEKEAAVRKLEAQIEREQRILAGKLKPPAMQKMLKEARETAAAEIQERKNAQIQRMREGRKAGELRRRITRHSKELYGKLTKPSDKQHIPEAYRGAVAALLNTINLESAYDIQEGTANEAGRGGKHVEKGTGTATNRTKAFQEVRKQLEQVLAEGGFTGELINNASEGFDGGLIEKCQDFADKPISTLNSEELETLWNTIRALEHNMSTYNKAFALAKNETISGLADSFLASAQKRKPLLKDPKSRLDLKIKKTSGAALKALENPYTFFSHYGEEGVKLYRSLRDAQDLVMVRTNHLSDLWVRKMAAILGDEKTAKLHGDKLTDAILDKIRDTSKQMDEKVETFKLENGQTLTLTHAMLMDVYLLAQRGEVGMNHLLGSGLIQPEIRAKGKYVARDPSFRKLSLKDIQTMTEAITGNETEKAVADAIQSMQHQLADWGNEASMAVFGYRKFTEDNYWPVKNAKEENKSDSGKGGNQPANAMNKGMAKNLVPHAATGMDPMSAFTKLQGSISDMLVYATWGPVMEDFKRFYNWKWLNPEGGTSDTVKGVMERYGGEGSQRYWEELRDQINNGVGGGKGVADQFIGKAVGAVKGARVAFNLRVVVQQPTAYARAGEVISGKYLAASLLDIKSWGWKAKSAWNRALEHSPIAMRKDSTTYDMGGSVSAGGEFGLDRPGYLEKARDFGTALAGKADAITWGRLWHAAELQVSARTKLEYGSQEYWDAVNKLFTEAVDRTQVVDGLLQRPAIMRTDSDFVKGATAYMGEPLMQLNMLMRQVNDFRQTGLKQTKKQIGKTVSALVVTQLINAMLTGLYDAGIRKDDDDKDFWERFMAEITGLDGSEENAWDYITSIWLESNVTSEMSVMQKVPLAKDLLSILQGYDPSNNRMDLDAIKDLFDVCKNVLWNDKYTPLHKAKELINKASMIFGAGFGNALKDMYGVTRNIINDFGNPQARFDFKALWLNPASKKNKSQYFDLLFQMLENGDKAAFRKRAKAMAGQEGMLQFVAKAAIERYLSDGLSPADVWDMMETARDEGMSDEKFYDYAHERMADAFQANYFAGKLEDDRALKLLLQYAGKDEEKAWNAVRKWKDQTKYLDKDGKLQLPEDYKWNQYDELKAAIAAGEDIGELVQTYKNHGYNDKRMNKAVRAGIQGTFDKGIYTADEAVQALIRYGVTWSKDGKTYAYDQNKGWQTVREWAANAEHKDEDGNLEEGYSYSLYDDLRGAIEAGSGIDAAMKELTDHGVKASDVNEVVNKTVLKLYTDGEISEKTAIGLLTKYHTVTKDKKTRPQTADEAWAALQKASAEAAHADEEDYSYSKYDDIDAALDKNADISKLVKQLTDHGEKQANITSHVKGYLIDRYVAGKTSESALKNQLSRYCGITKTDEVAGILKDANCEKDCGYGFGEIKNAYGRGDLSEATAKKMLRKYGELTDSGAEHRIGFWDYCRKNPDTSISAQGWDSYYEKTLPNIGGTLSGRGMKQSSFTEYLEKRAQLEITDLDGDGKKDNKEYIVNLIASLNLSSAEKDMLYYYNNYGARDLWKTPWH